MNRAAVGLGSWLLQAQEGRRVSLDLQGVLLDCESFAHWREESVEDGQERELMRTLVREIWQGELSGRERHVLRAMLLEGKSENELARELGMHHSAVGRCRQRAEEKMRGGLRYVMRYRALLEQLEQDAI
jgi:DNA-directed RNA polymerase specialized sigma subunit